MLRNWTQAQAFFTLALKVTLLTNCMSVKMNKLTDAGELHIPRGSLDSW